VNTSTLILTGAHPYYPALINEQLVVEILAGAPGQVVGNSDKIPLEEVRQPGVWMRLAGYYELEGLYAITDRIALLGLLWDLEGAPIHPTLPRRPRATYALVRVDETHVEVYRAAAEMHFAADEKAMRIREEAHFAPDRRRVA
jgi:hypothetical protein